jgi:hypothetical protein
VQLTADICTALGIDLRGEPLLTTQNTRFALA